MGKIAVRLRTRAPSVVVAVSESLQILVVEDDPATTAVLAGVLRREGWAHGIAEDLQTAWELLRSRPFDLLLLDLGLPDGNGAEILRRVRDASREGLPDSTIPVLIISGNTRMQTRVNELDAGADAYVTKPFHPDEVAALIRAILRRAMRGGSSVLQHRGLALDREARTLSRDGVPVAVSAAELQVLRTLLEASPRVLSRAEIQARNRDVVGDPSAVEVHVHHLRRKLGEDIIRTVRGLGYCIPADKAAAPR